MCDYKKLYYSILRIRMIEEAIAANYSNQKMRCPVHLSIGQEAVAVGVIAALDSSDYVFSSHRSHAHYIAKGGDLNAMIAEIYGKANGCSGGFGGSMHLMDRACGFMGAVPIVGSTIPIAVGAALACAMDGRNAVVAVFFGEGATEEGVFHESMNFASVKQLPILFICENNLYSVYTGLAPRQPVKRPLIDLAKAHGVQAQMGDGNDAVIVYKLVKNAVKQARYGGGPQFLVFHTYRFREHCGPDFDNHLAYRSENEFLEWKKKDPLEKMEKFLKERGLFDDNVVKQWKSEIMREINLAFQLAEKAEFPKQETISCNLFSQ